MATVERSSRGAAALGAITERTGALLLLPLEVLGMTARLLAGMAHLLVTAPIPGGNRYFRRRLLARDLWAMIFGPVPIILPLALILGTGLALGLAMLTGGILTLHGSAGIIALVAIQQVAPFLASGLLAARGALPLAVDLADMARRRQIESLDLLGVDVVMMITTPRCLALVVAACAHAALAMVVSAVSAALALTVMLDLPRSVWSAAFQWVVEPGMVGSVAAQMAVTSTMAVAVGVVDGLDPRHRDRLALSGVARSVMLKAAVTVVIINMAFTLWRIGDLPVLVLR
ncbi:ABC transporter permease [Roseospira visakhapatnamensis]|uniref:ABC-type transporter Mla maintaining outer membrane lipid asymmetry permease subunit MlaE n=1 Tax=Roseospira visakhapatnamensis TaxID=390880 RepID=A0A7W6RB05_9PROT|nr:ABC transporter permease [Roseospira visakhapatnamensis]MBB4265211.1 ABC-type transporter Mla maintaining outer membrane lipid asymmetry permease subunit MlaE [Roseospira visakhapatnamensis]